MIEIFLPIKLQSPNVKEHWRKTYNRNKRIGVAVGYTLKTNADVARIVQKIGREDRCSLDCEKGLMGFKLRITLVRSYSGKPMDYDNFVYAFKSIRDSCASFFYPNLAAGQADCLKIFHFTYAQEPGPNGIKIILDLEEPKKKEAASCD